MSSFNNKEEEQEQEATEKPTSPAGLMTADALVPEDCAYQQQRLWDQRKTLKPPPYEKRMRRYLRGLDIGDELFDQLDTRTLLRFGHGGGTSRS